MHQEARIQVQRIIDRIYSEHAQISFLADKTLCKKEIRERSQTILKKCIELEKIFVELFCGEEIRERAETIRQQCAELERILENLYGDREY